MIQSKIAWQHGHLHERPFCEAPRHRGLEIPAHWSMAIVNLPDDADDVIQSMCHQCMNKMARELGTTAEKGASA